MRFVVDVHNPAEVFACWGLLELISWQDPAVLSHFETQGASGLNSAFIVQTEAQLPNLRVLSVTSPQHADPLIAPVLIGDLRLDWWLNQWKDEKSSLKLWAGTNRPAEMLGNYQERIPEEIAENILQTSIKTKTGKASFGFDLRASRDALKVGYSQKEAGDASVIFPTTEFLCALGLQNFRPSSNLEYFVWRRPIPISIAHAACRKEVPGLQQSKFTMGVRFVGQGLRAISEVYLAV